MAADRQVNSVRRLTPCTSVSQLAQPSPRLACRTSNSCTSGFQAVRQQALLKLIEARPEGTAG
jgi:hypothetical protein